jgi:hypothetical protein
MNRWALIAAAFALAFAASASRVHAGTGASFPPQTATSGCQVQGGEPDPACTPGAVFSTVTVVQICTPGYARSVRDVSVDEKRQVYTEYGLSYPQAPGAYEADHLVSLELGGSNDIANLWPEAVAPASGFHQKDAVEDWLHDQVCAGTIDLASAQQAIASDWISVWEAAGEPGITFSTTNPGEASVPPSGTSPAPPPNSSSGGDGHTYYASTASNASTIYCDNDSDWRRLSPRNLVSFPSLAAAMAALSNYHLHRSC